MAADNETLHLSHTQKGRFRCVLEVPWRDIVDMRNALVHGYITTNPQLVWETYTSDLPLLKKQVEQFIEELKNIVEPSKP